MSAHKISSERRIRATLKEASQNPTKPLKSRAVSNGNMAPTLAVDQTSAIGAFPVRPLLGSALPIANVARWWRAARPLSGSERRGRRSFRQPGRRLPRPYLVEAGTATFEQRPKVSGRSLAQLRRWLWPPRNSVSKSCNYRCTGKCLRPLRAEGDMSHRVAKLCAGQINQAPVKTGLAAPHAVSQLRHPSSINLSRRRRRGAPGSPCRGARCPESGCAPFRPANSQSL